MMALKIPVRTTAKKCVAKFFLVHAKELRCFPRYRPVRMVLHRVACRNRRRWSGYVVSELSTRTMVCGGFTEKAAIQNTKDRLDDRNASAWKLIHQVRLVARLQRSREGKKVLACA